MKTLIIFALIAVIGLSVLGAGPGSFINNVGAGGVFLFSGINIDSAATIVKEIEKKATPITETVEKGTFSLSKITDNTTKLSSDDTDNMTKEKQAEMEVHRLINLEREKHGLKILGYDETKDRVFLKKFKKEYPKQYEELIKALSVKDEEDS